MKLSQKSSVRKAVDKVLRRAEMLRVLQMTEPRESVLVQLRHTMELEREAREALRQTVVAARGAGASWREIGDALYISRQAAQQHYGDAVQRAARD